MSFPIELLDHILSAIEQQELRSLQWGFVDGSMGQEDLRALVQASLDEVSLQASPDDLEEELISRSLLFEYRQEDGSYRYRSRFAEGVRLLTAIRQIFPDRPWASSPALVSDYRVDARPRTFPRRNIPAADALAALVELPQWSERHRSLAEALLQYDLAGFQVRAFREVLRGDPGDTGVVVCAGTGSGKTLTFYVPAFIEIGTLVSPQEHWVKAVALYPRIELLKDQFQEAYKLARRLDQVLLKRNQRKIRIGTFFSLTPRDRSVRAVEQIGWTAVGSGFVCPFLSCPECGGDMIWLRSDLEAGIERLVCRRSPNCTGLITVDEVVLTRRELVDRPADIVFTTTETLNQRLSDTQVRHVLGVTPRRERKLRMVLLDEVHTYSGPTGAQTALVLRRWRHAIGAPVRWVGLSATLREAPHFLAELVGLVPEAVVEASPAESEFDYRSMIYQLVLRGNPAAQTQLLSTAIQASFLLARLLDPMSTAGGQSGPSGGFFGNRLFVFTDDLDVTNRLFDNLRDAEGYTYFGRPDPSRKPLAALRENALPDRAERDAAGQNWRATEKIGHLPSERLLVSRTSSQDAGVNRTSNVIVATASLEVGYNDPTVGAVLQHKSPHGMAAYVQRKGRAGRGQSMRPWIVTVLSDYGRDRLTYQAYEQLFDPVLAAQRLPVRNRYILRMQAALALLDWLAEVMSSHGHRGWIWYACNGPAQDAAQGAMQTRVIELLTRVLEGKDRLREQFCCHLSKALQLESEDEVAALLWEAPRSIMLEVIPTLLRRLRSGWKLHAALGNGTDLKASGTRVHPLPDFLPATLFSALNVPDVTVVIPPATRNHEERVETQGIVQALSQLVPGRITRRYAYERGGLYHWVPVPLQAGEFPFRVSQYAEQHEFIAMVPSPAGGEAGVIPCYRPWTVRLEQVSDRKVRPSSSASLSWSYQVIPTGEPTSVSTSFDNRWGSVLGETAFFLHNFRSPVIMRRYALAAEATLRIPGEAGELNVRTRFTTDNGEPSAIGFEQTVDGMRVRINLPAMDQLNQLAGRSPNLPAWRAAFFRDRVMQDPELGQEANWFQRDWLHQIYLSALLTLAVREGLSLAETSPRLHQGGLAATYNEVMDSVFRIDPFAEEDNEVDGGAERRLTMRERLTELLGRPTVSVRLQILASSLWAPDLDSWNAWLVGRIAETVAGAALQACHRMSPRHVAPDSLLADVAPWKLPESAATPIHLEVWVTEANLGGAGVMEAIAEEAISNPRRLFTSLDAALAPGELEVVSSGLDTFVRLVQDDPEVAAEVDNLRRQHDHVHHQTAFRSLVALLARKGLTVDPSVGVALHQRLLRPGMTAESDALIWELLAWWQEVQKRLGITVDLRVFCYMAVVQPAFAGRIEALISANTGASLPLAERVSTLAGILWPRAAEQRGRSLQSYSPFHFPSWSDPTLVRDLVLTDHIESVAFGEPNWLGDLNSALSSAGTVRLTCSRDQEADLHRVFYQLLAEPINMDYLQFYLAVDQVQRDDRLTSITLSIKEIV